ncbi:MAG: NAD-dependent epimerase/dehydratase family protein [Phycisphaerales bacterium]
MTGKAIITGGAGFIGSHLAARLKAEGTNLILIDNLSTGRRSNIESLLDDRCTFIESDACKAVTDPKLWDGVDKVYHLAAAVGVQRVIDDPAAMVHNNVEQTAAVLDAARKADAAVLIASSSEVYGKCPVLPLREDMELVYGPTTASRWSYGLTKAIDEHLAIDMHRRFGLRAVIVRLFNTIGPRQVGHYGMVVPRFVERAVAGQTIDVYGDGTQTRAFCDVRDVTRAMTELMAKDNCFGRVFNLGSDQRVTINELADRVIRLAGGKASKRLVAYEQVFGPDFEDPAHRLPDVSRIREAIGFKPTYTLDQTLTELIALSREAADGVASSAGGAA